MGFGDLKSPSGLETLNAYLADKSYIEGFQPSQADAVVFNALSKAPDAKFVNALRWYNHINSYGAGRTSFPGQKKDLTSYGPSGSGTNAAAAADDDDDDVDLFGSDEEEDEEYLKEKQRRVEEYNIKKAQKKQVIAKSNVILDVKPWDDETDMKAMEKAVRSIKADGLVWGASKLVPVGYGINKLQITIVIEDDKISTDWLEEQITGFEDYVQSMDIAAFNKI